MPKTFGERFKALRKARFANQERFREKFVEIFGEGHAPTQAAISYWESGKTEPSMVTGCHIAVVLGVSLYELMGIAHPDPAIARKLPDNEGQALAVLKDQYLQAMAKIKHLEGRKASSDKLWEVVLRGHKNL